MRIIAITEHTCSICHRTIAKGEKTLICFNYPKNSAKNEFDVFYICSECEPQ